MVSGASGRKRIQPDEIEKVSVPLPPLEVQQAIVARWQEAQEEAARLESQASDLETQILDDVLERLGLVSGRGQPAPKVFVSRWRQLDRWSVDYTARQLSGALDVHHTYFPLVKLRDVASVSYGIQKSPQNRPGAHARPYLRVANVQNGRLDLSEVKFINVPDAEMPLFRLQAGDLLVCEGKQRLASADRRSGRTRSPDCVHPRTFLRAACEAMRSCRGTRVRPAVYADTTRTLLMAAAVPRPAAPRIDQQQRSTCHLDLPAAAIGTRAKPDRRGFRIALRCRLQDFRQGCRECSQRSGGDDSGREACTRNQVIDTPIRSARGFLKRLRGHSHPGGDRHLGCAGRDCARCSWPKPGRGSVTTRACRTMSWLRWPLARWRGADGG